MPTAAEVLAVARAEIGVVERPAGSNRVKYWDWYDPSLQGNPWCAAFVSWCFDQAGMRLAIQTPKGFHYTPSGRSWFDKAGRLHRAPQVGDVALFDFPGGKNRTEHTGIVESVSRDGTRMLCIEGNTGVGNDTNGGAVMRRERVVSHAVFGRPAYGAAVTPGPAAPPPPVTINLEEDGMPRATTLITIGPLGAAGTPHPGKGWASWDPGFGVPPKSIQCTPHGPFPPADGYWDAVDGDDEAVARAQVRGNAVVIAITKGTPGGYASVWVEAAA